MFVAIELKRDDTCDATKLQAHTIELINKCGGIGIVMRPSNFEKVVRVLEILAAGKKPPSELIA